MSECAPTGDSPRAWPFGTWRLNQKRTKVQRFTPEPWRRRTLRLAWIHGPPSAFHAPCLRHLPRHDPRRRPPGHHSRRPRPGLLGEPRAHHDPPLLVGLHRVDPPRQPLPPAPRDLARASLERHATPERALRAGLQPAPRPRRASLRRSLPGTRHPRRRPSRGRHRLRARQRRARRALRLRRRLAVERRPRPRRRRAQTRGPAPTSRAARPRRSGRSGAGTRAHARLASSCGSAWCPRR